MSNILDRLIAAANGDHSWRGALFRDAAAALRDSGSRSQSEDPRSVAEAEGRQNGAAEEQQSPNVRPA